MHGPKGDGGFGYDPYFEYLSGETFAEMAQEEKNHISHRASAKYLIQQIYPVIICIKHV